MNRVCQGCGAQYDHVNEGGVTHAYLGASPQCWAVYGEVLAREYSTPELMGDVHRISVDAYAAQHPGSPEPRTIQSINVHLAGLFLTIEEQRTGDYARNIIAALTRRPELLTWLPPPRHMGDITVQSILDSPDPIAHAVNVRLWGASAWNAWREQHKHISALVAITR